MSFWIIAVTGAALVTFMLMRALWRGVPTTTGGQVDQGLKVYRDQLAEVERDVTRGVLSASDAARVRTEVSRRILAADISQDPEVTSGAGRSKVMVAVIIAMLMGGTAALYLMLGAPGYGDLALKDRIAFAEKLRQTRPSQAQAEAELPLAEVAPDLSPDYETLLTQLRSTVASRPDDIQGHVLLAQNEARVGNYIAAAKAQSTVVRLKGADATLEDVSGYAELLVMAAGGYVSPEAEAVLRAVLKRDVENGTARYYWGLMLIQTGRPDLAFRMWDGLLRRGPEDAPWIAPIQAQIGPVAELAGVDYTPPVVGSGALRGPSSADVDAAKDMTPAERMEMISTMVDGLSQRLATEGGPVEDWARLISSLGVLGETKRARAIFENAREVFGNDPAAMDDINRAGERAGVAE